MTALIIMAPALFMIGFVCGYIFDDWRRGPDV